MSTGSEGSEGKDLRIAVIGGGIAGVSAARALAEDHTRPEVVLLEAEGQLAHHTTGRSAAQLIENYGAAPVRPLTRASLPYLRDPPPELCPTPLLRPQPVLTVAPPERADRIEVLLEAGRLANPEIAEITPAEAVRLMPALRVEWLGRVIIEPGSSDIDVSALHQSFVRALRRAGGRIETSTRVDAATRPSSGGPWSIETTRGTWEADIVVNAAGAWGDVVAARAGVAPVGLVPKRRTAFMVASRWAGSGHWPMAAEVDLDWYLKPDGSQFLCSPGDETPSEPVDAKPEELDIARAIEQINEATTLDIRSVRSSWAGLRTFASDGSMVIGPDPDDASFIWCVGQGGTGIQTSPAAGQLVADLTLVGRPGSLFADHPLDLDGLAPARFRP